MDNFNAAAAMIENGIPIKLGSEIKMILRNLSVIYLALTVQAGTWRSCMFVHQASLVSTGHIASKTEESTAEKGQTLTQPAF